MKVFVFYFAISAVAIISEATFSPVGKMSLPLTQASDVPKPPNTQDTGSNLNPLKKILVDINDDVHGLANSILDMVSLPVQPKLTRSRRSVQNKCAINLINELFSCAKPTANDDVRLKVISPNGVRGEKDVNKPVQNDGEVGRDELLALLETEGLGVSHAASCILRAVANFVLCAVPK